MIKIDALTCWYDEYIILDDISLHVSDHLSVLGANGSGKSTFAKALCRLIDFEGTIQIQGEEITALSPLELAKKITYIPTKLESYDPYISVYEFVLLGRFAYKQRFFDYTLRDIACAIKNLKLLGIEHLKEHTIHSLSSGEQQLALIAQALTQESQCIIFDEPTANLDPSNSKVIANHIKRLKATHQIILITHDLHLASYLENPVLFIAEQHATLYEPSSTFFDAEVLAEHYGVSFENLAVNYE
jgi:iron complex transport system ATP-binding protein